MGTKINVSCTISYSLLDVIIATVLYIHGSHINIFLEDGLNFSILRSVLDIWGTALLRASLLLGASIGVLWNREHGPHRLRKLTTLILLVCQTIITYTLAKLLMLSELEPLSHRPWSLSLLCWTCFSSLAVLVLWWVLGKENSNRHRLGHCEDTAKLLEPDCEEEEKEGCSERKNNCEKEERVKTTTGATLGRLLSYTKKDGGLLTVAIIFLIISAVFGVRGGVFTLTFARLNLRFRNHLFRTLMNQDIGFFDENHTGDITSRLSADTTQVSDLISQNINVFLRSTIKAVGFLIFMFGMSWKLTLVNMMGLPFIALLSEYYGNYYKKLTKEVQTTLAKANKVAEETISAMKTVRSFANEHREADSYYDKLVVMYHLNKKQALAYACYMWSSCISELALEVTILAYGGHLVVTGQMESSQLLSFFIYMLEMGECLANIASVYSGLMQGVGAAEKVFEYLDRKPDHPADGTETLETFTGLVDFQDIKFAYPTRPEIEILKGVSFTLKPGEVTALVGPSGSGKSSCVNLLENFYVPQHGQVLLDGKPVHSFQHGDLHSQVALVGQEPVLFARTIEENITYGLTDVPMEAVIQAATKANAHDFIMDLPQGYQTSVGEKGAQLSGGQKQRVAIARALVRQPRVLILDEATSALDAESEHIVQQALNNIMREHTVLVVAHRLSTVERADSIIVIDKGRVAEQGSHGQLMASGGLYYKLVQRQVLGIETGDEVLNLSENSSWKPDGYQRSRQS
uniref:ATP-binding cassette, sub-family B (MDR/TAP), member 9 n=1 Tax=Hippocampus comes TaxID=109280 RepID=A0A3Q2XK91_HIPCM